MEKACEPKREITVEDVRAKLSCLGYGLRNLRTQLTIMDTIIDKDTTAGTKEPVTLVGKEDKAPVPNLRFDMNRLADEAAAILGECSKLVFGLQHKLRTA